MPVGENPQKHNNFSVRIIVNDSKKNNFLPKFFILLNFHEIISMSYY